MQFLHFRDNRKTLKKVKMLRDENFCILGMGRMRSFLECWSRSLHKRVPGFSFGMLRCNEQYITVKKRRQNRLTRHKPRSPADFFCNFLMN